MTRNLQARATVQHVRNEPLSAVSGQRLLEAVDIALGVAVVALTATGVSATQFAKTPLWTGYLLAVLAGGAVAGRRRWPLTMLLLASVASLTSIGLGFTRDPLIAAALVLYIVAAVEPIRVSLTALALVVSAAGVVLVSVAPSFGEERFTGIAPQRLLATISLQAAAWAIGFAVRRQRAYVTAVRERAEREVEAQRDLAWRAVTEERLQIARDLHDVVAHSMSVIAVQAGVGRHLMTEQPERAGEALAVIETTTRDVLREMRSLLGVLREDPRDRAAVTADGLQPTPTLGDLETLVARSADAGLRVDLHVAGERHRLPDGIETAAYRIVQEALTNVVKHASTNRCLLRVEYRKNALAIEVTDDGSGPRVSGGDGHGIIGMRERATIYGGDFDAGPLPVRGYRVATVLPIPPDSP
jgi:signal transduction histidine kinase